MLSNPESHVRFIRPHANILVERLREPRRFVQVVAGPRQVGKTTLVRQVLETLALPCRYSSADEPTLYGRGWIAEQWDAARAACREAGRAGAVLALDEIHKVEGWSDTVKRLWDEDSAQGLPLRVVLLGSAPLLLQRGLGESLAGRFEVIRLPHWSLAEMQEAFGWTLEQYLYFGGYPGAAPLAADHARWKRYILDSLVETTLSRDVLLLTRVDRPALLRRLFDLACRYSGQILSYQKMLGQLQDAGNTTTLAHYLDLLAAAGMVVGLQKYSPGRVRQRGSSPKLQVLNSALLSAVSGLTPMEAASDREFRGRMVESAVGSHLANAAATGEYGLYYWRERNREIDFVVTAGRRVTAVEVKSGRRPDTFPGMDTFIARFQPQRRLLVGADGIPLEEFLLRPVEHWTS